MTAYKGLNDYVNEAAPLLAEYNVRKRLAELGYRFDPDDLSAWKADAFSLIGAEIGRCEMDELKKKKK